MLEQTTFISAYMQSFFATTNIYIKKWKKLQLHKNRRHYVSVYLFLLDYFNFFNFFTFY